MRSLHRGWIVALGIAGFCYGGGGLLAQQAGLLAPRTWTAQEDHQNMMDQLGIKSLRPGPSGNEQAPNHANYDEATANPFPNLPDVLTLHNGTKVTSAAMWDTRRKEILEDFDREVLGRVPKSVPKISWTVTDTVEAVMAGHPVVGKALTGHVDNSGYPAISVDIQMTLVTPKDAKGPVPVMMMFGGRGLPGAPAAGGRGPAPAPPPGSDAPATDQLIADGWGYASINPASNQSASSTAGSRASRTTGARSAPGRGARRAASTISKPSAPSMPGTSASKASHATARRRSSPWRMTPDSWWSSLDRPAKAAPSCIAATGAKRSRTSRAPANTTGWPATF
jgi:hypothetical protein